MLPLSAGPETAHHNPEGRRVPTVGARGKRHLFITLWRCTNLLALKNLFGAELPFGVELLSQKYNKNRSFWHRGVLTGPAAQDHKNITKNV